MIQESVVCQASIELKLTLSVSMYNPYVGITSCLFTQTTSIVHRRHNALLINASVNVSVKYMIMAVVKYELCIHFVCVIPFF